MAGGLVNTVLGKVITDDVTIFVGGSLFSGWQSVRVTENLEAIASEFSISLFENFTGFRFSWPLKPGLIVIINIGLTTVMTGHIEKADIEYSANGRSFVISGRSNSGDLVDCTHEGLFEFKNIFLDALARILVAPFGILVFTSVVSKLITKFAIKPGETVFEALDRAARLQGLLFISTRRGNIRLTKAGADFERFRAFSSLKQDVNILSASASYDDTKRFNQYKVVGQAPGTDLFSGLSVAQPFGVAFDVGIIRNRPLTLVAEDSVDFTTAATRAQWEASVRLANAIRVKVTVQGWSQEDKSLWGINQRVGLESEFLGLNRDMLIANVVRKDGFDTGKTTDLTLIDPQAYGTKPVTNAVPGEDILSSLGSSF